MDLKQTLVKEFAKVVSSEEERSEGSQVRGTIEIKSDGKYVHIDGAPEDVLTPITEGIDEETGSSFIDGDRVLVLVKDHQVTFVKNLSVNSHAAESAMEEASEASRAAEIAYEAANEASAAADAAQTAAAQATADAATAKAAADEAKEDAATAYAAAETAQTAANQALEDAATANESATAAGTAASIAQSAVEATVKEHQTIYFASNNSGETMVEEHIRFPESEEARSLIGTWLIKENPSFDTSIPNLDESANINFISNGISFSGFFLLGKYDIEFQPPYIIYEITDSDRVHPYENDSWVDQSYRTLTITGGEHSDTTTEYGSILVDWFDENATLVGYVPEKPTNKVTTSENVYNAWTTIVPAWNENYPYYWEAIQYNVIQILGEGSDPPYEYVWVTGEPHRNYYIENNLKNGKAIEDSKEYFYHDSSGAHVVSDKQGGNFRVDIASDRLSFVEENVEVAYINGKRLYIKETVVLDEMQVGNDKWSWKYDNSDDSFYLKWIGGNV